MPHFLARATRKHSIQWLRGRERGEIRTDLDFISFMHKFQLIEDEYFDITAWLLNMRLNIPEHLTEEIYGVVSFVRMVSSPCRITKKASD